MNKEEITLSRDSDPYIKDEVFEAYKSKYDIKKIEKDTNGVVKEWTIKCIIRYGNTILSWNKARTMFNGKVFPKNPGEEEIKDLEKDISRLLHFPVTIKYNAETKYVDPDMFKKEHILHSDIVITRSLTRSQLLEELNEL